MPLASVRRDRTCAPFSSDQPQVTLEQALDALLICFISDRKPPDWIQVAAKVYRALKVWYSPESLREHYFRYLKECATEDSSGDSDGRSVAFGRARELAKQLAMSSTATSQPLLLLSSSSAGSVKKEEGAGNAGTVLTSNSVSTPGCTSSAVAVNASNKPSTTSTAVSSSSSLGTPQRSGEPRNAVLSGNENITMTAQPDQALLSNHSDNENDSNIDSNNSNSNNNFILPGSLLSLWNVSQSQDFLLELLLVAQNLPDAGVFSLSVAPRVQVYLHGAPIGRPYADVVYQPTSVQVIREKIIRGGGGGESNSNSAPMSASAMSIRTLCQLYLEVSKMVANCVMFNLPGGYYPLVARNFMVNLMNAWADHVAKTDH